MAEALSCSICGEATDERVSSICSTCGERFHLNPRNDVPGKDCGTVWINEQHLALEFACQRCVDVTDEPEAPRAPRPRILRPQVGRRRYRKKT